MRAIRKKSKIWEYLNALGVLERGNEEEIKAAKKAYRRDYFLNYRRKQREKNPEFVVSLSKNKGEYSIISLAAKSHKMKITTFIRTAVLAYIGKTYIVPDKYQLAQLEQLLAQCLNEVQILVSKKENIFWDKENKIKNIEERIEKLEKEICVVLKQPLSIEETVIKEINSRPALREQLLILLNNRNNDNQNKITQGNVIIS
jgi:hypothetical protein